MRHPHLHRRLIGLVVLLLVAAAPVAEALARPITAAQLARSRQLVLEGNSLYERGRFLDALRLYEQAYELRASPNTLFNIGQCLRYSGQIDRAIFTLRSYLLAAPQAPNRTDVEVIIGELRAQQGRPAPIPGAPPAADADYPGPKVTPTERVLPPADVEYPGLPAPPPGPAPEPRPAEPTVRPFYRTWWFWTLVGTAVAGAVVGGAVAGTRVGACPRHAVCR